MTAETSAPTALREMLAGMHATADVAARDLLDRLRMLGQLQATLDAAKVSVAAQLIRRWATLDDEADGASLRDGHRTPAGMLAARWQITYPTARQLCLVAEAITPRRDESGELKPATFPQLASALDPDDPSVGRVSIDQAAVIITELEKAAPGCTTDSLSEGEHLLVTHAPNLTVADVRTLAGQVRDRLDLHGILPREKLQTTRRSLTISTTSDGMTHIDWYLHPEAAGHVITAIDTLVGTELRTVRFRDVGGVDAASGGGVASVEDEHRSLAQLRSDAATDVFRTHATKPNMGTRAPVTMVVRVSLDTLRSGLGHADIDGIRTPISASTARRLAADANIIPAVLGGNSEVLDLGRAQRLFTPQQKVALAERDGGCAWPGCRHPPSYTEAHHIDWWNKHNGPTDLDNGILLCTHHHHRVHDNNWHVHIHDNTPWFTPPTHIDPHRRPRRGGRIRMPTADNTA